MSNFTKIISLSWFLLTMGCQQDAYEAQETPQTPVSPIEQKRLDEESDLDSIEVEKNKEKIPHLQKDLKSLCSLGETFSWGDDPKTMESAFLDKARSTLATQKISKAFEDLLTLRADERKAQLKKVFAEHGLIMKGCDRLLIYLKEDFSDL